MTDSPDVAWAQTTAHEIGHAVVAHHLGWRPDTISRISEVGRRGFVSVRQPADVEPRHRALVCAAGFAGEVWVGVAPQDAWPGSRSDRERLAELGIDLAADNSGLLEESWSILDAHEAGFLRLASTLMGVSMLVGEQHIADLIGGRALSPLNRSVG